jgi:Ca2+-binding RTX toxin-like protein
VDWESDYITWYFDGTAVSKLPTPAGVDKPMYILADLAVGGDWPGSPNASTPFPADFKIDYIRAYAAAPTALQTLYTLPVTPPTIHRINGTSRNNTLTASLPNTYFDTWGGNDTMTGLGNDVFEVYTSRCVIRETNNAGIDTVLSGSSSFVLPSNVENITLIGIGGNHAKGAQSATGNALDNLMISNSTVYANTLSGGAGRDELIAGRAADVLTGGTGVDEFVFSALPSKAGHVTDFSVGTDMLDLRGIFSTAGYTGSDPIADHHLVLTANSSGGTSVYFDPSVNPSGPMTQITTLDHVVPTTLRLNADIWV